MKPYSSFLRVLLTSFVLVLVGGILNLSGQSTITIVGPPNGTRITDCETGQLIGGGYSAAIFWAPTPTTDRDQFLQLGANMPIFNGMLAGGTRTVTLPIPGATVDLFGAAWETAAGTTYQEASQVLGAKVGCSDIVTALPDGAPVRIPDFQVCPVPEPSTWALVVLALSALLFRQTTFRQ